MMWKTSITPKMHKILEIFCKCTKSPTNCYRFVVTAVHQKNSSKLRNRTAKKREDNDDDKDEAKIIIKNTNREN